MRIWRRSFATSFARLNSRPATTVSGPPLLRCAQVLDKNRTGPNSLEDQEIKLQGYINNVRKHKRFSFVEFVDGSTVEALQAMVSAAQAAGYVPSDLCFLIESISQLISILFLQANQGNNA